eukprot:1875294-Rhodomonas_salina.1
MDRRVILVFSNSAKARCSTPTSPKPLPFKLSSRRLDNRARGSARVLIPWSLSALWLKSRTVIWVKPQKELPPEADMNSFLIIIQLGAWTSICAFGC